MATQLLTVKDLANRWQKDPVSIRRYIQDGIITPCAGVPGTMFRPDYIERLEGVEINPMSSLERKKLLKQIEELKFQNNQLKAVMSNILAESSKVIQFEGIKNA